MVLTAQLLGSFQLTYGTTAVSLPSRATAKTLLAYLLLHQTQTHTRAQLADLLASDVSEEQARRVLSRALWHIRQSLPIPLLEREGERITLSPEIPLRLDVTEFSDLVNPHLLSPQLNDKAAAALQKAVSLYRGELLSEFYDDWLLLRRELLREKYLHALWLLSKWEKENGRFQSALHHLLQLSQADPLREEAHCEIMRCYLLLNRPNAAMRQYELCVHLLQTELQLEPEPTTRQLWQDIRARREAHSTLVPMAAHSRVWQKPPLIGRQTKRKIILQQLQHAKQGEGNLILLEGNAGSGKTCLCQTAVKDAAWRNIEVLGSDTTEIGQDVPYQALIAAVQTALTPLWIAQLQQQIEPMWLQLLAPFLPAFANPDEVAVPINDEEINTISHQQMRVQEAWIQLLIGWSQLTPLFLVIEDVHEADPASLALLTLLAHRLHTVPIVLLLSYREDAARQDEALWHWLQTMDETAVSHRISLSNFSAVETGQFVRALLALETAVPQLTQQIFQITGGNPFFILETLNILEDTDILKRDERGNWRTQWDEINLTDHEIGLPARVELAIAQRMSRLDKDAQRLLLQTAVLRSDFNLNLLHAISPFPLSRTLIAINQLVQRHFIIELPDSYTVAHHMIRQTAYAQLTTGEKQHAHQQAALALQAHKPQEIEALAFHHAQAGNILAALDYYLQAAQQARQQFALQVAKSHLDKAINLYLHEAIPDIPQATAYQLFVEREAIAHILGDSQTRHHDLKQMHRLAQDSPTQLAQVARKFARFYNDSAQPDFDLAFDYAQRAINLSQQQNDLLGIATAYGIWGHAFVLRGDAPAALEKFDVALTYHQTIDEPAAHAAVLLEKVVAQRIAGQHPAALTSVRAALSLFEQQGDKMAQVNALAELSVLLHEQGQTAEASLSYEKTVQLARDIGYRYREATTLVNWGNLLWFQGNINQTLANYEAASLIFGELGNAHLEAQLRSNLASFLTSPFAEFAKARNHAEWALAQFKRVEDWIGVGQALATLGAISEEEGDLQQAAAYLAESLTVLQKIQSTSYVYVMALRQMALVQLECGLAHEAIDYVEQALAICQKSGMIDMQVTLWGIHGMALLHLGRLSEALTETGTAVAALHEGVDQQYLVWWWRYQLLVALERDREAAQALHEAYRLLLDHIAPLTPAQQQHSLTALHDHAHIVAQWQAGLKQITVSLPHIEAPTGRPLRPDEFVSVTWSLETVADAAIIGKKQRRQQRLLRLLDEASAQQAAPTVPDLAKVLQVSPGTIKRDFAALRQAGQTIKTRGS